MRTLALLLALAFLTSCAHQKPATTPVAQAKENPVIVRLVSQHQTITVRATGHGPRYSVTDSANRTLIANATLDELRAQHPDIYRQIEPAIADQSATADNRAPNASVTKRGIPFAADASRQ
jgi:hypothetical protein